MSTPRPQLPGMSTQSQQLAPARPSETTAICSLPMRLWPGQHWPQALRLRPLLFIALFPASKIIPVLCTTLETMAKLKRGNFKMTLDSQTQRDLSLGILPQASCPRSVHLFLLPFHKMSKMSLTSISGFLHLHERGDFLGLEQCDFLVPPVYCTCS